MTIKYISIENGYTIDPSKDVERQRAEINKLPARRLPKGDHNLTPKDRVLFPDQTISITVFPNGEALYRVRYSPGAEPVGTYLASDKKEVRFGDIDTNLPRQSREITIAAKVPGSKAIKVFGIIKYSKGPNPPKK